MPSNSSNISLPSNNSNSSTNNERHRYSFSNSNSNGGRELSFPDAVSRKLLDLAFSSSFDLSVDELEEMDKQYVKWVRFYERMPTRAAVMNDLHDSIKELLRVWVVNIRNINQVRNSIGITNREQLTTQTGTVQAIKTLTSRTIPANEKYKETAYLIPLLSRVMSRYEFIRRFDRLSRRMRETGRNNNLQGIVTAHANVASQIRDLKRTRRDARQRRRSFRELREPAARRIVRRPDARSTVDELPAEPRPNWVNAIAETNIKKKKPNNENQVNLMTLEPMKKGIKLPCDHYISKSTLRGMVQSGRTLACPYCRRGFSKANLS